MLGYKPGYDALFPAEVTQVIWHDQNPSLIYGIMAVPMNQMPSSGDDDNPTFGAISATPIDCNFIRVPYPGEIVLITEAPNDSASGASMTKKYYYTHIISIQGSIHHNSVPKAGKLSYKTGNAGSSGDSKEYQQTSTGNAKVDKPIEASKYLTENPNVKSLQPYPGDTIISGRYGQSIRFSTTPKVLNDFIYDPMYSEVPGNPITLIRNTTQKVPLDRFSEFTTETELEENLMIMASGQKLEFTPASVVKTSLKKYSLDSWDAEKFGTTPQTLLSSGRLIFNSTQKEIVAFAKGGIALSSETAITIDAKDTISVNANLIELGTGAKEPLMLGNKWKTWMENLIQILSTMTPISPVGPCVPLAGTPQWSGIESLKGQLSTLLSDISFTAKTTSISQGESSKTGTLPEPKFSPDASKTTKLKSEQQKLNSTV